MINSNVPIRCVLAIDSKNGIAKNGKIPWRIPEDLEYFKELTISPNKKLFNVVVMGKNTWDQLPEKFKPLRNRINIVISTTMEEKNLDNLKLFDEDNIVCNNVETAFKYINERDETFHDLVTVFICGGKQLYDIFLNDPMVKIVYATHIHHDYECDTLVKFNFKNFKPMGISTYSQQDENNLNIGKIDVDYCVYNKHKNIEERQYLNMLKHIITNGNFRPTRNANTFSCFGSSLSFNLSNSFPLLTSKKMFLRGIFEELKFFLLGQTNTKILEEKKVNIWKGNTSREFLDSVGLHHLVEGDMGPLYGFQLRHYGAEYKGCDENYEGSGFDQLQNVLHLLKTDKYSRRIMMTTFNPIQIKQGPLPPCHGIVIQFGVEGNNKLSCHTYQR